MLSNNKHKYTAADAAPRIGPDYQAALPLSPPLPPTTYLTHSPSPSPPDDDVTFSSCSSSPVLQLDGDQPSATATAAAANNTSASTTTTLNTTSSSSSLAVDEGAVATDMEVVVVEPEPVTHTHTHTHTHAGTDVAALERDWEFVSLFTQHFFDNGKQWNKILDGLKEDGVKCLPKKKRDAKNALLHYYQNVFKHTEGYLSYVLQSPAYTEHIEDKYASIPPTFHDEDFCYQCGLVYEDNPDVKTKVLCESCQNTACRQKACSGGATKDVEWHCQECKDKYTKTELAEATKATYLAWDAVDVKRRNAVATIIATLKVPKVMRRIEARKQREEEQENVMLNLR